MNKRLFKNIAALLSIVIVFSTFSPTLELVAQVAEIANFELVEIEELYLSDENERIQDQLNKTEIEEAIEEETQEEIEMMMSISLYGIKRSTAKSYTRRIYYCKF